MSRLVWPRLFELYMVPPLADVEGFLDKETRKAIAEVLETDIPENTIPVALRWRLHHHIGVPRMPFKVWRRSRDASPPSQTLDIPNTSINGTHVLDLGISTFFNVRLDTLPAVGQNLTIQALDDQGKPIIGETLTVHTISSVRLRAANIGKLQISGNGTVLNFRGVTMQDMANDPNWEQIEIVGLPVKFDERSPDIYLSTEQGLPFKPVPGVEAAVNRLRIGELLYQPPSASGPGGEPTSDWPTPQPELLVFDELRGHSENPLPLVLEMLEKVDPIDFFTTQSAYERPLGVTGMRQPGGGTATDDATVDLPVAGLTLMTAASDMWGALGLGFGTTDFPPFQFFQDDHIEPTGIRMAAFDYMVTFEVLLPFGLQLELAALASVARFRPQTPAEFHTNTLVENRPFDRDTPNSHEVELRWRRLPRYIPPQGYALAILEGGGLPLVLNDKRIAGGFTAYVAARDPQGNLDHERFINYVDNLRIAPLIGNRVDTYLCAALDVFGRWSDWEAANYVIGPQTPAQPQVLDVQFNLNVPAASGRVVPAAVEIEIAWDWEDRSPHQIEIVGQFYAGNIAPTTAPGGIQTEPGGVFALPVVLEFSGISLNQTPTIASGRATVTRLPVQADDGDARRYKVIVPKVDPILADSDVIRADFSATTTLAYAVYARANEQVNPSATAFSDFTNPTSATVKDPLPAAPPTLAGPPINWTALPDATGVARYRLSFSTVTHADGYIIYEATEAAIRRAAGLAPITDQDITTRATELFNNATRPVVRDTYARLNPDLLEQPQLDVELPGAASGFYVYRVSSMTKERVESELSGALMVAVPRRITPGIPNLRVQPNGSAVHIHVEDGIGEPADHIELFRTRSTMLMTDIDFMGPPVADESSPWTVVTDPANGRTNFQLNDPVPPSWLPYYYRAVALGAHDEPAGLFPGRSGASPTIEAFIPPAGPPDLTALSATLLGASRALVQFRSAAELRPSPLGNHKVGVLTIDRTTVRPESTTHVESNLASVIEDSSPSPAVGTITRRTLDGDGRWLYETVVPLNNNEIAVRIVDPKGRIQEQRIDMPEPPPPLPDLVDLQARIEFEFPFTIELQVSVRSRAPVKRIPFGEPYVLEILVVNSIGTTKSLAEAFLHEIGTTPVEDAFFRSKEADSERRFTYGFRMRQRGSSTTIRQVILRLTDPRGNTNEQRRKVR